jgi:hypothetical protein
MDYFEADIPSGQGLCSDNSCPCDDTVIPRGSGYLFIEQELVEFRRKYPILEDALEAKELQAQEKRKTLGITNYTEIGRLGPILVCERGARLRNLDLDLAAADAKHWWETGMVPL